MRIGNLDAGPQRERSEVSKAFINWPTRFLLSGAGWIAPEDINKGWADTCASLLNQPFSHSVILTGHQFCRQQQAHLV
jgi:hypothetical protein